jgi:hypothetical protein
MGAVGSTNRQLRKRSRSLKVSESTKQSASGCLPLPMSSGNTNLVVPIGTPRRVRSNITSSSTTHSTDTSMSERSRSSGAPNTRHQVDEHHLARRRSVPPSNVTGWARIWEHWKSILSKRSDRKQTCSHLECCGTKNGHQSAQSAPKPEWRWINGRRHLVLSTGEPSILACDDDDHRR